MKPLRNLALLAAASSCLLVLTGCHRVGPPIRVVIAVDVSDRTEARALQYASWSYRFQSHIPNGWEAVVVAFAHDVQIVYDGPPIRDRSAFNESVVVPLLRSHETIGERGTRPAKLVNVLARLTQESPYPVTALVLTDGGIEDNSPAAANLFVRSTDELARSPKLRRLVVAGVLDRHRERWRRELLHLGGRAVVRGSNDALPVLRVRIASTTLAGSQ